MNPSHRLLLAGIVAAVSCDGGSPERPLSSVRDSAGVRVIENHAPLAEPAVRWVASSPPALTIGTLEGPAAQQLFGVRSVHRVDDGRLLVAQSSEISFFDPDGRHAATVGGKGNGPGEYAALYDVQPCGSGLVAEDMGAARVSVLDASGGFLRLAEAPELDRGSLPPVVTCFEGDLVYVVRTPPPPAMRGLRQLRRDTLSLVRFGQDGQRDTVLQWPGLETFDGLLRPFGRTTLFAFSDSLVHLADSGSCEVRSYTQDGALRRILRCSAEGPPVSDDDVAAIRERYTRGVPPPLLEREILPRLNAVPFPDTKPTLSALRADDSGNLWLQLTDDEGGGVARWIAFDGDGELLGEARLPEHLRVHVLNTTEVVGVWRDSLDVEYVHGYRMEKQEGVGQSAP